MKILITGAAGFIGFHLTRKLLWEGYEVVGLDNFNDYYDPSLKEDRAALSGAHVEKLDLRNQGAVREFVLSEKPDVVIHLAAYAGVRDSAKYPMNYIENNIVGSQYLIEACKEAGVEKVLYASTSCTMAGNELPWKEDEKLGFQLNPYGYTKACNEAQFRSSGIPNTIGMRFFTVYGPWGRPDMALFSFTKKILAGESIDIYNHGCMTRDFTFVKDIVEGVATLLEKAEGHDVFNIGYGEPVGLMDYVHSLEKWLGVEAEKNMLPKHPADTKDTWADTTKIQSLGWKPTTATDEGVRQFVEWYKDYYEA